MGELEIKQEIRLPPLPVDCITMAKIGNPEDPNIKQLLLETIQTKKRIDEMFQNYFKKCEISLNKAEEKMIIPDVKDRKFKILFNKLAKMVSKHKEITREIDAEISSTLSILSVFFGVLIDHKFPVTFDFEDFQRYANNKYRSNKKYQKLAKRIKKLQSFLTNNKPLEQEPISFSEIADEMKETATLYNPFYAYTPPSKFDTLLLDYFIQNHKIPELKQVVRDICGRGDQDNETKGIQTPKRKRSKTVHQLSMNMKTFNQYYTNFVTELEIAPEYRCVIKASLLRIVFSNVYTFDPLLMVGSKMFSKNAYLIRNLTPSEMKMPAGIFREEEKNIIFIELFTTVEILIKIREFLETLSFYDSPLDLALQVCYASQAIDEFAAQRSPSGEVINLSFDDFFIVFIAALSTAPPTNAEGIRICSELYSNLDSAPLMRHAMTSLSAAIGFINNFGSDHPPELEERIAELSAKYDSLFVSK